MVKAMTNGMRMGMYVQIDGEISKTNAAHREGNLITLSRADLGKMLEKEGAMDAMKRMDHLNREEFQKFADELDGLDIDLQQPIIVNFK